MLNLLQFNLPILAVALAIGLVTGRWLFHRKDGDSNPS